MQISVMIPLRMQIYEACRTLFFDEEWTVPKLLQSQESTLIAMLIVTFNCASVTFR